MAENKTRRLSPGFIFGMMLIGTGFIVVGIVLFFMLQSSAAAPRADEYSTIPAEVNYAAPELELTDLSGSPVSLADYRGSVVLVNMWATWCPPCKAEMPDLQAFYEKYKAEGLVIVGINDGESRELVEPFVHEYGLTFPIWLDEEYRSEDAFNTINLPSSYVIDRTGTVRLMWIGAISPRILEQHVSKVIKE